MSGLAALVYPDEVPDGQGLDWDAMVEGLAKTAPAWPVGTRGAYHGSTYGHLVGELIRRITGQMPDAYFRSEIADPVGIDYWYSVPATERHRVSEVLPNPASLVAEVARDAREKIARAWGRILPSPDIVGLTNDPRFAHEVMPSAWGKGNARAIGKLYAALSVGGTLDGYTVISPETLKEATTLQWEGVDPVTDRDHRYAMGLFLNTSEVRLGVGDVHVYVSIDGEANEQALLFLHGLTDSTAYYRCITSRLAGRYRVASPDFRGHGRSDRAERYTTPDFLNDAVAACEQVAGAGCVVIAHSFGGLIGAALAQQRPDLVRAVFLEDPLWVDPAVRTDLLGDDGVMIRDLFAGAEEYLAMIAQWQRDGLSAKEAASMLEPMPSPLGVPYSEAYFPEAIGALAGGKLRFDLQILDDFAAARSRRDAESVFDPGHPIDVPGLVLAGDPSVPGVRTRPVDIERLQATSPKINHQTIEGAGHFMHDERNARDSYTEALTAFLTSLDN